MGNIVTVGKKGVRVVAAAPYTRGRRLPAGHTTPTYAISLIRSSPTGEKAINVHVCGRAQVARLVEDIALIQSTLGLVTRSEVGRVAIALTATAIREGRLSV